LSNESNRNVADAKWKLIASHENNTFSKYGLSQSDMYQMFAYGTQYQSSNGHMLLIYPKHAGFQKPLPVFSFSDSLHLWVVPLCIEKGKIEKGDWSEYFACFQEKLEFEGTSN
jgi:5-methylcytosine-specific restriction enzyme subunit McrC